MAAPTLTELREGLAVNLLNRLTDTQVSPYMLSNPTPPSVHIYPGETEYDLAMRRGLDRWILTVQAFAGVNSDIGSQTILDAYLAPSGGQSIKEALEADQTLGGILEGSVHVLTCSGYQVYARDNGGPVLGAEWSVEILATGV